MPSLGLLVELLARMTVGSARPGGGSAVPSRRLLSRIAATHWPGAFALARSADMRSSFALLLGGLSAGLLSLGSAKISAVAFRAVIFRGAGFSERDRDCLPA